jgi:hypothetical protein
MTNSPDPAEIFAKLRMEQAAKLGIDPRYQSFAVACDPSNLLTPKGNLPKITGGENGAGQEQPSPEQQRIEDHPVQPNRDVDVAYAEELFSLSSGALDNYTFDAAGLKKLKEENPSVYQTLVGGMHEFNQAYEHIMKEAGIKADKIDGFNRDMDPAKLALVFKRFHDTIRINTHGEIMFMDERQEGKPVPLAVVRRNSDYWISGWGKSHYIKEWSEIGGNFGAFSQIDNAVGLGDKFKAFKIDSGKAGNEVTLNALRGLLSVFKEHNTIFDQELKEAAQHKQSGKSGTGLIGAGVELDEDRLPTKRKPIAVDRLNNERNADGTHRDKQSPIAKLEDRMGEFMAVEWYSKRYLDSNKVRDDMQKALRDDGQRMWKLSNANDSWFKGNNTSQRDQAAVMLNEVLGVFKQLGEEEPSIAKGYGDIDKLFLTPGYTEEQMKATAKWIRERLVITEKGSIGFLDKSVAGNERIVAVLRQTNGWPQRKAEFVPSAGKIQATSYSPIADSGAGDNVLRLVGEAVLDAGRGGSNTLEWQKYIREAGGRTSEKVSIGSEVMKGPFVAPPTGEDQNLFKGRGRVWGPQSRRWDNRYPGPQQDVKPRAGTVTPNLLDPPMDPTRSKQLGGALTLREA